MTHKSHISLSTYSTYSTLSSKTHNRNFFRFQYFIFFDIILGNIPFFLSLRKLLSKRLSVPSAFGICSLKGEFFRLVFPHSFIHSLTGLSDSRPNDFYAHSYLYSTDKIETISFFYFSPLVRLEHFQTSYMGSCQLLIQLTY